MSHIFISYSRKDFDFAGKIVQTLADNKLDTWIDWKSIPKGEDWEQEIYRGIEEADVFLFLISRDSIRSNMCNKEIAHAAKNGKRIIPIVIRSTRLAIPEAISKPNWIYCQDGKDNFGVAIAEIIKTIHTDYEWVRFHTKLQLKALEWQQKKYNSRLLRGKDLREAERQLANAGIHEDPNPTNLQHQFILASRKHEERQRRQITIGLSFGLVLLSILSVFAWAQRNTAISESNARATAQAEAELNAKIARAGELAALALFQVSDQTDLALLLSVEAYQTADTYQTRSALYKIWQYHPRMIRILQPYNFQVTSMSFSPDGNTMALGGNDGTIQIWNIRDGIPVSEPLSGHSDFVFNIAFNQDGKILASAGNDGVVILWDLNNNQQLRILSTEPRWRVTSVAFSPDGEMLACGRGDGSVQVWSVASGQLLKEFNAGYLNWAEAVVFSRDSKMVASGHLDGAIRIWDIVSGQPINKSISTSSPIIEAFGIGGTAVPPRESNFRILSVAVSPDNKVLASGSWDGIIQLWNMETGEPLESKFTADSSSILGLAYTSDGQALYSVYSSGEIWKWYSGGNYGRELLEQLPVDINSAVFNMDGNILVFGDAEEKIWLWDLVDEPMLGMGIPKYPIDMEIFSPNREIIALWNADAGTIQFLNARNGDWISEFSVEANQIESMIFSPDGRRLAFGTDDGVVQLWDISSNQPHGKTLVGHHGRVSSLAFSSDGTMLASGGSQDYTIMVWDVAKGENINTFDNPASILGVAFIDGNDVLASIDDGNRIYANDGGRIRLWDLEEGKQIKARNTDINGVSSVTFSPDGKKVFLGNQEGSIWLWNVYEGQPYNIQFAKIPNKKNDVVSVTDIAFDLDVGLVIATDYHGSIWVWDLETGQLLGDPLNRRLRMVYTSVTMYGYRFATGASDIWIEINPETWVSQLCAQAGRNMTLAEWRQYFAGESYHQTCPQWPTGK